MLLTAVVNIAQFNNETNNMKMVLVLVHVLVPGRTVNCLTEKKNSNNLVLRSLFINHIISIGRFSILMFKKCTWTSFLRKITTLPHLIKIITKLFLY